MRTWVSAWNSYGHAGIFLTNYAEAVLKCTVYDSRLGSQSGLFQLKTFHLLKLTLY